MRANSAVDFVIKISKYCNLRCSYCYEFSELGIRKKMQLGQLRAFFANVRNAVLTHGRSKIHFVWHGGEPLLIPIDYYKEVGKIQREVLGTEIDYANVMQTNLTVLTRKHIDFLSSQQFFNHAIGVSFDVYGDQRVDTRGRLRTDDVLANIQRLKDAGIAFGAICVLARNTFPHISQIYRFYDSIKVPVRFLPFYKSANESQIADHALTHQEITGAFRILFDDWFTSEHATDIAPLSDYLRYALAFMASAGPTRRDPDDEHVFLVDTNGDTYGVADTYVDEHRYGNLFCDDFNDLLASGQRRRSCDCARARMAAHCASCPYFGYCPGSYVADATSEQRRVLMISGCPVREIISHMVDRLKGTAVLQAIEKKASQREHPEIAVGA